MFLVVPQHKVRIRCRLDSHLGYLSTLLIIQLFLERVNLALLFLPFARFWTLLLLPPQVDYIIFVHWRSRYIRKSMILRSIVLGWKTIRDSDFRLSRFFLPSSSLSTNMRCFVERLGRFDFWEAWMTPACLKTSSSVSSSSSSPSSSALPNRWGAMISARAVNWAFNFSIFCKMNVRTKDVVKDVKAYFQPSCPHSPYIAFVLCFEDFYEIVRHGRISPVLNMHTPLQP